MTNPRQANPRQANPRQANTRQANTRRANTRRAPIGQATISPTILRPAILSLTAISLAWLLVSRRLKRFADKTDSITLPDVLAARFDDKYHLLRSISVLIILVMVMTYVAAQMVATGKAFSGFMDISYTTAVVFGASIIIAYTLVGGYKAVAYTDLLQGILMLLGLIIVPLVAIDAAGGWDAVTNILRLDDPTCHVHRGGDVRSTTTLETYYERIQSTTVYGICHRRSNHSVLGRCRRVRGRLANL